MTVTGEAPIVPALPIEGALLEPLVSRLSLQYDVEPSDVRMHAAEVLRQFSDARLHAFVPVLVEKQLRERLRRARAVASPATSG